MMHDYLCKGLREKLYVREDDESEVEDRGGERCGGVGGGGTVGALTPEGLSTVPLEASS